MVFSFQQLPTNVCPDRSTSRSDPDLAANTTSLSYITGKYVSSGQFRRAPKQADRRLRFLFAVFDEEKRMGGEL
jgi:hypothetical protein